MGRMIFDILETNFAMTIGIALLCLFAGKLRRRYGAGWMKFAWILLVVRLLIPYNFSMPFAWIRLLNYTGFEQERNLTVEDVETGRENELAANDGAEHEGSLLTDVGAGRENVAANVETVSAAIGQEKNPAVGTATHESGSLINNVQAEQPDNQITSMGHGTEVHNGNIDSSMEGAAASTNSAFSYTYLLIKIWIAGVVISLLYFLLSYIVFYNRCKKSLRPITNTWLIKEICRQQKKYIGHAKIMVYKSQAVSSPMLTGLICPKLIVPADAERWNAVQLELIMAHEMCHYRKKDLWLKIMMVAACCVNWFNPMVYVMKKQFAYDMELACDGSVLEGRNDDERESYARIMLILAGGKRDVSAFSTGFGASRKQMQERIDYMLDTGAKKKGILSIMAMSILILVMGVVVSCGYKVGEENGGAGNGLAADGELQGEDEQNLVYSGEDVSEDNDAGNGNSGNAEDSRSFDYNHVYNDVMRYYQGDLYLAEEDGIYYLKGGQGEGELLYSNPYEIHRGMEIDGKYLYFCGSAPEGKGNAATVYRMDLDTHEVVETLAEFELEFPDYYITNVSVYEGNLYVAIGEATERYGFALNENGEAVSRLDQQAADYIYREYNEYMKAEIEWLNSEYDSEEYWELAEAQKQRYLAVIDVASCKKLLGGRQVVSQYKDELLHSIYLENEDGTYKHVCDTMGFPTLVTEIGLYYPNVTGEIWYADFETKQTVKFYGGKEREWVELSLITYDADYIYLLQNKHIGYDMENNRVMESYLVRVPRMGGDPQKVYRFADQVRTYGDSGWYRHCGVYGGRMYFNNRESFSLDPEENNMQAVNSGEPCKDAVEITETVRVFADAYFANDEETLRALLTEDFEERVEMYAYPEHAEQIREEYIGGNGIPDEDVAIGVTCYVFYEFGGHAETGDALAYLSMELTKTEDGFKVKRYEMEM